MKPTARMVYRQWLCTLFVTNLFAATASSDADQATTWNVANMKNNDHRNLATKLPTNLALNRPVVLSSVSTHTQNSSTRTGDGFRLSDGDRGTHFFQGKGCAETTTSADPWARIDFGREVPLAVVRLWTRADSSKTALSPIQLPWKSPKCLVRELAMCRQHPAFTDSSAGNGELFTFRSIPVDCTSCSWYSVSSTFSLRS